MTLKPTKHLFLALALFLLMKPAAAAAAKATNSTKKPDPPDIAIPFNSSTASIIDGFFVAPNAVPFFATTDSSSSVCGGSLVWTDVLLSAAHCEQAFLPGTRAYIGGVKRQPWTDAKETFTIKSLVKHPRYNGVTDQNNDIMVVILNGQSKLRLGWPNNNASIPTIGQPLVSIGHGSTNNYVLPAPGIPTDAILSPDLKGAQEKVVSDDVCVKSQPFPISRQAVFCTVPDTGVSCAGDSGGPILDANLHIVGLTSFGSKVEKNPTTGLLTVYCTKGQSAYTRVSTYAQWIFDQICLYSANKPSNCGTPLGTPPVAPVAPVPTGPATPTVPSLTPPTAPTGGDPQPVAAPECPFCEGSTTQYAFTKIGFLGGCRSRCSSNVSRMKRRGWTCGTCPDN